MAGVTVATRRGLQLALAAVWLLDAGLQFQPSMFSHGFAHDVVAPAGVDQPGLVAGSVRFAVTAIASHPVLTNAAFGLVQLVLGLCLLVRRTARVALMGSIVWSAGVWWFGEGAGGVFSGHAMLLTGAPGSALLYALVAVVALPRRGTDGLGEPPRRVALVGWVGVWLLGAVLQLLPGQNSAAAVRGTANALPSAFGSAVRHVADGISRHPASLVVLVLVQLAVGLLAVRRGPLRAASCGPGVAAAAVFWVFGQALGALVTGQSTDPNTAPLLVLLAVAVAAIPDRHRAPATHPAKREQLTATQGHLDVAFSLNTGRRHATVHASG